MSLRKSLWARPAAALAVVTLTVLPFAVATAEEAAGQGATPLEVAVREVLTTSPGLRAEAERLRAAEQAVAQARAVGLPNVSLAGSREVSDGTFDPGEGGQALFDPLGV